MGKGDGESMQMYDVIPNSPVTELLFDIDSTQTEISIADTSKLPDAPNLATIGVGEDAETVLYLSKDSTRLLDVTRGFQGKAQEWLVGTPVARVFTAYDYEALVNNIKRVEVTETAERDILTFRGGS